MLAALLAFAATGCAVPLPSDYVDGGGAQQASGLTLGKNAAGEACTAQSVGSGQSKATNVFCGTWQQPSGVVRSAGPVAASDLLALATSSPWRQNLEQRFACDAPKMTTILDGVPAAILSCRRRQGGWAHVALVAAAGGGASGHDGWYADGVLPAWPPVEHAVGLRSGRLQADASTAVASSAADALMAHRLAAEAFSSSDIGRYDALMTAGSRANQAERFAAAESAFRAALALQQKALGANNPNTAITLERLALQISNQGRTAEADALFARAGLLAAKSDDPLASAKLSHYLALNLLNETKVEAALAQLDAAEAAYSSHLPPALLNARPTRLVSSGSFGDALANRALVVDPTVRAALAGTIEVRRYRAVALRLLGRNAEGEAALQLARTLANGNNLREPVELGRLTRTAGAASFAAGNSSDAAESFASAATTFGTALPSSRPLAETRMLEAAAIGNTAGLQAALAACQDGTSILRQQTLGVLPAVLSPCLKIFATAAEADPTHRQALLATMFEAAQLAQGGITGSQIAQATARLAEAARDPKVADAIRRRQDAGTALTNLERYNNERVQGAGNAADTTELDGTITQARSALAEADAALQAASPNYGQLVQEVVTAKAVLDLLRPDEAFVSIGIDDSGGWIFVLRRDEVKVARVTVGLDAIARLVQRVRTGVEPTTDDIPPFDTDAAYALYQAVLGPVSADLDGTRSMVVAPTGPLLSVPFEVLLTAPSKPNQLADASWLLKRVTIAHVPAAANFVSLRKISGTSRAAQPWFGFGEFNPVTPAQAERSFPGATCADSAKLFAGLPPLPFAGRELEAARQLLGGRKQDSLLGPAFTAKAVMDTPLKDYRILHFATHALLPAELRCQSEAAIVTSDPRGATDASGALLTVSNVVGLDLDADAVILSACNSGGGGAAPAGQGPGKVAGESLSGLARAFFYAGARSLMVTHWSVNDQTAAYLVAQTMKRVHEGAGIADALRDAQLSLLTSATGRTAALAHPFYWAPFAVIGDGGGKLTRFPEQTSRSPTTGL